MASFFNTLLFTPLLPSMKYIPYIFLTFKPKIKSKAKSKVKPKIIKPNLSKASSPKYDRE